MLEMAAEFGQLIAAFLLFCVAHAIGAARERSRKPKPVQARDLDLRCGCNHELSFHEGLGACKQVTATYVYNKAGNPIKKDEEYVKELFSCTCQQYTGDLPADWYTRDVMKELP